MTTFKQFQPLKRTLKRKFNVTLTKGKEDPNPNVRKRSYNSVVRNTVNMVAVCVTHTKGLRAHLEVVRERIFRELVASREMLNARDI